MKKKIFYEEAAYGAGLLLLAFGTALTEYGGFGISMVVAPAYILYLKVSEVLTFFTFGMAEYVLQAVILLVMMLILRKVKAVYFLSFLTTVLYGIALDASMMVVSFLPENEVVIQLIAYIAGVLICTASLSLLFHAYLPPEAYEMFVKEVSARFHIKLEKMKTAYDCTSLITAILLSVLLFGELRGIGIGTVVCALIYGILIGWFSKLCGHIWEFRPYFKIPILNEKERNANEKKI